MLTQQMSLPSQSLAALSVTVHWLCVDVMQEKTLLACKNRHSSMQKQSLIACKKLVDLVCTVSADLGEHSLQEACNDTQRCHLSGGAPQGTQHLHRAVRHPHALC